MELAIIIEPWAFVPPRWTFCGNSECNCFIFFYGFHILLLLVPAAGTYLSSVVHVDEVSPDNPPLGAVKPPFPNLGSCDEQGPDVVVSLNYKPV